MTTTIQVGAWQTQLSLDQPFRLAPGWVPALEQFLNGEWLAALRQVQFPHPWGERVGIERPSPLIRVDFFPQGDPSSLRSRVAEVELRPAGLGLLLELERMLGYGAARELTREAFGGVDAFVQFPDNPMQDDVLLAQHLGLPFLRGEELPPPGTNGATGPVWLRMEEEGSEWEPWSVVPGRSDGLKDDLVLLGLASPAKPEEFGFDRSVVFKPRQGKWCRGHKGGPGIAFWVVREDAPEIYRLRDSRSNIAKIQPEVEQGAYLEQPFIMPLTSVREDDKEWLGVARCYFGWIGGAYRWIAGNVFWCRHTLRLHGGKGSQVAWIEPG